ncbi:MAG: TIGR03364 family FAD-dependent oxidoreductase [Sphingomonadaceae bacterium]
MSDVIVVGAGIIGLAHAWAAARRGKKVLVIDRDDQANGASVRNFGFITVSGQERGRVWDLARRTAGMWREVAREAAIPVAQEGLLLIARRPEALAVIDSFMTTEMGAGCTRLTQAQLADICPTPDALGAMHSSVDLRVESRTAIPRLAAWLEQAYGVEFRYGVTVRSVESGRVETTAGEFRADCILVCPGDNWSTLYPETGAEAGITRCKLQMLRLAPPPAWLPAPVMSDLSMVRYTGYAHLPEANALLKRLRSEEPAALDHGIHLIVVQSEDGSLVVGDSHVYAPTPDPFALETVDAEILRQYAAVLGTPPAVIERWTGIYASAAGHSIVRAPADGVRLIIVTSGTGASTGFALAEDVVADLFDS